MIDFDIEEEKNKYFNVTEERTFQYDDNLPNLPIPKLEKTLKKYLDSVKPHVTNEEYTATKEIVLNFKKGIGSKLQFKLLEKYQFHRNWLEEWWENKIYLEPRTPIIPFGNLTSCFPVINQMDSFKENFPHERASMLIYYYSLYWKLLRQELLPPQKRKTDPFSMNQWRRLFNCCRVPGLKKDFFVDHFKTEQESLDVPTHVSVLHRGHVFIFNLFHLDQKPLSPPEISCQIQYIINYCKIIANGLGVGALTCCDRTIWYQERERLVCLNSENAHFLHLIESSMFTIVLDENSPSTSNMEILETMGGDIKNRWADKSLQLIIFANGKMANNCDHGPFDALALLSLNYYAYLQMVENNFQWRGNMKIGYLPSPQELKFNVNDSILSKAELAMNLTMKNILRLNCFKNYFYSFGKTFITTHRRHPDTFIQLALQLAYYRMHNRPAPTYETASTRMYYHGRTETVRSCTLEAMEWVKSMMNPFICTERRLFLMNKAFYKHNVLMEEAIRNHGCDRHLMGLYLTAVEEGLPIPKLFLDPSFRKSGGDSNFVLSTSLSGYTIMQGAVAPMCENGYGVFYSISKQSIPFTITTWKTSKETDPEKFYKYLSASLLDMKDLIKSTAI